MMSVLRLIRDYLWSEEDGSGYKILHIVSDNNLINVAQRLVLSPFRTLRRRKCSSLS